MVEICMLVVQRAVLQELPRDAALRYRLVCLDLVGICNDEDVEAILSTVEVADCHDQRGKLTRKNMPTLRFKDLSCATSCCLIVLL